MSLLKSAKTLIKKQRSTNLEKTKDNYTSIHHTNLWSKSKTASQLIPNIEGIVSQFWNILSSYDLIQVSETKFYIKSKYESSVEDSKDNRIYTNFNCVRIVIIFPGGIICSCIYIF